MPGHGPSKRGEGFDGVNHGSGLRSSARRKGCDACSRRAVVARAPGGGGAEAVRPARCLLLLGPFAGRRAGGGSGRGEDGVRAICGLGGRWEGAALPGARVVRTGDGLIGRPLPVTVCRNLPADSSSRLFVLTDHPGRAYVVEVNVPRGAPRRTDAFRALAASVLLLFGAASAGRGYCPMRAPAPTGGAQAGSHDCCKKGLTGAKPSCCHADTAADAVVLLKSVSAVSLPAVARIVPVPVEVASAYAVATSTFAAHSPPPSVLRI